MNLVKSPTLTPINKTETWFFEAITEELVVGHGFKDQIFTGDSKFQHVDIVNLGSFGKCLIIDGHLQSSEIDEHIYHESLVHPALILHPNPEKVFIAGGGEGATAREVLRHKSVESLVMVDIDDIVVRVSKEYLPKHHLGAFEDPRLKLVLDDALVYLQNTEEKFDVIIMDLPDPIEEGPAYLLYTQKFYQMLRTRLSPTGIVITQSGPGGPTSLHECFSPIHNTLRSVFDQVAPYSVYVPSFGDCNGFNLAFQTPTRHAVEFSAEEINTRIEERITGGAAALKSYDGATHKSIFSTPKHMRTFLEQDKTLITEETPLFCFQGHEK